MSMRERILDAAEARMRSVGYNATSFRDIAGDVGVKSASVHYHFPQKEDLGEALMERYTERQFSALEEMSTNASKAPEKVQALIDLHDQAFVAGERICLCAMLSAESQGLPEKINAAAKRFLDGTLDWLKTHLAGYSNADAKAEAILALLQGALIVSAVHRDKAHFKRAVAGIDAILQS